MSRVGGKRDENKKKDRCVHAMKLCGGENDERFEKIETSRDRCATAPKNFVGNKPGNEGAGGCDKRDRKSNQLKLRRLVIDVMHFLQEAREVHHVDYQSAQFQLVAF